MAAIAGLTTLLPAACRICAPRTDGNIGHSAITSALALIAIMASAATPRSDRAASTMAPPGICNANPARLRAVRARPMSTCVHPCAVR